FTGTVPNDTGASAGTTGAVPVPVKVTGVPAGALSVTCSVVDSAPAVDGVNVNCTVQFDAAFTLMGSALHVPPPATCAKSAALPPVGASAVIISVVLPVFESVRDIGALVVPRNWFPNGSGLGDALNIGPPVAISTTPAAVGGFVRFQDDPAGGAGRFVLANIPLNVVGGMSVNEFAGAGMKPAKSETFSVPASVAVPLTTSCE